MSRQFRSDDTSKWLHSFGNGSAGNLTYSGGTLASAQGYSAVTITGTSGATTATLGSALGGRYLCLIHQTQKSSGAGVWELNILNNSSSSTTATLEYPLQNTYTAGAQLVTANQYKNITLSGTTTVSNWNGSVGGILFLACSETLTIGGSLTVAGKGFRGYTNPGYSNQVGYTGEGHTGGRLTNTNSNQGNGGGGGVRKSGGAGGGNATAGGTPEYEDGLAVAGTAAGNANLTVMVFGGAGGSGHDLNTAQGSTTGGHGGGIVFLMANSIVVNGTIVADGNAGSQNSGYWGGGGGAGGSVLFKASSLTLGSSKVTASGGAKAIRGGTGSVGRIAADYSSSVSGSTNPTGTLRKDTTIIGTWNITASAGAGGSISPSGTTAVAVGGSQKYTMTASSGYYISSITVDGTAQTITNRSSQDYTFSNVQATHTISVAFTANPKITTNAGSGGLISPNNPSVTYGGSQSLTISANSGYQISSIAVDGSSVAVTDRHSQLYSFANVTSNHTLSATFEDDWHLTVYGYNAKTLYTDGVDPRFSLSLDCNAQDFLITNETVLTVDCTVGYRIEQYVLFSSQTEAHKFWNGQSYSGIPLWFINDVREDLDLTTILEQRNYWIGIITDTYPNKEPILLRPHRDRYLGDVTYPEAEPTALLGT